MRRVSKFRGFRSVLLRVQYPHRRRVWRNRLLVGLPFLFMLFLTLDDNDDTKVLKTIKELAMNVHTVRDIEQLCESDLWKVTDSDVIEATKMHCKYIVYLSHQMHNAALNKSIQALHNESRISSYFFRKKTELWKELSNFFFYFRRKAKQYVTNMDGWYHGFIGKTKSLMINLDKQINKDFKNGKRDWMNHQSWKAQRYIWELQNKHQCSNRLFCRVWGRHENCNFSCRINFAIWCLTVAIATGRSLIIPDPSVFGMKLFRPVFNERLCLDLDDYYNIDAYELEWRSGSPYPWPDTNVDRIPPRIPPEFTEGIFEATTDPLAWYIGQITRYIFRPSPLLGERLSQILYDFGFETERPIAGIQVKLDGGGLDMLVYFRDQMRLVDNFYLLEEAKFGRAFPRRVFVVSPDPKILGEIGVYFPKYEVLSLDFEEGLKEEPDMRTILNIMLMSHVDFLVCSMVTEPCRLAYQLSMAVDSFASDTVASTDIDWWYPYDARSAPRFEARLRHKVERELEMREGDEITQSDLLEHSARNVLWKRVSYQEGLILGYNKRTKKIGRFPKYKVIQLNNSFRT